MGDVHIAPYLWIRRARQRLFLTNPDRLSQKHRLCNSWESDKGRFRRFRHWQKHKQYCLRVYGIIICNHTQTYESLHQHWERGSDGGGGVRDAKAGTLPPTAQVSNNSSNHICTSDICSTLGSSQVIDCIPTQRQRETTRVRVLMRANREKQHAGLITLKCYTLFLRSARNFPKVEQMKKYLLEPFRGIGKIHGSLHHNFSWRGLVCEGLLIQHARLGHFEKYTRWK